MTPLVRIPHDVTISLVHRAFLLEQPCEFFSAFFNGRTPSMCEKLLFIEQAIQRMTSPEIYQNDIYRVEKIPAAPFIHLDIRRLDGQACKEWSHFQQIKNELVGPEYEAVELFPAESRLVDAGNQYHLWVHADPTYRFQVGFRDRFILRQSANCDSISRCEVPAA